MKVGSLYISVFRVGEFLTNTYFVSDDNKNLIVIDPADEADYLSEKILQEDYNLKGIFLTHGHSDHVLAAGELQVNFKCKVYLRKEDNFLLRKQQYYLNKTKVKDKKFYIPPQISYLKHNQKINLNTKIKFSTILLPGHTPGLTALYSKNEKICFSGDMIFPNCGMGRTDFGYSDPVKFKSSLKKILKLPRDTVIFPGHGECFQLKEWKKLDIEF